MAWRSYGELVGINANRIHPGDTRVGRAAINNLQAICLPFFVVHSEWQAMNGRPGTEPAIELEQSRIVPLQFLDGYSSAQKSSEIPRESSSVGACVRSRQEGDATSLLTEGMVAILHVAAESQEMLDK